MNLAVISLGCAKNTVDTERMLTIIPDFNLTLDPLRADAVIINTCGFLKSARAESEKAITDMLAARRKNKKLKIIVAGCHVTHEGSSLIKKYPGVDAWVGVNDTAKIRQALSRGGVFESDILSNYTSKEHLALLNPYSAYIKIAEGCNHCCSFCVIPNIKGEYRSRKIADIAAEAGNFAAAGVREINLVSQDTSFYGRDLYGKRSIGALLKIVLKKLKKDSWLRLLYLYPDMEAIKEIAAVMKKDPRVCAYFDIPFQHAEDKLLSTMKRGHGLKEIKAICNYIKKEIPGAAIRSSFITGYPGETKKAFNTLLGFVKSGLVDLPGIFVYSDEPDAASYRLKGKVSAKEAAKRGRILKLASKKVSYYNARKEAGMQKEVLVIGKTGKNTYAGRTKQQAPDIDGYVTFVSKKELKAGQVVDIIL